LCRIGIQIQNGPTSLILIWKRKSRLKDVLFDIIEKQEEGKFISLLRNRDRSLGFEKIKMWNTIATAFEWDTGNEFSKKRLQSM
jgi:hypothetical protein